MIENGYTHSGRNTLQLLLDWTAARQTNQACRGGLSHYEDSNDHFVQVAKQSRLR
jgi:hypothetical protein